MNEKREWNPVYASQLSGSGLPDDSHSPDSADFYEGGPPREMLFTFPRRGTMWFRRWVDGLYVYSGAATLPDFCLMQRREFHEKKKKYIILLSRETEGSENKIVKCWMNQT